jgi:hypothetical protein
MISQRDPLIHQFVFSFRIKKKEKTDLHFLSRWNFSNGFSPTVAIWLAVA